MSKHTHRLIEWIQRHKMWQPESRLTLAVSGGVDSMSMMHLLHQTQRAHKAILQVATIDHGLRESSSEEVEFVSKQAAGLGIPCFSIKLDIQKGGNVQARAREARRQALTALNGDMIATAHHLNDQAETVLYRLMRGSGTIGLKGVAPVDKPWCRPMMCFSRPEIVQWAEINSLEWREDPSNPSSLRGKIRQIFPQLNDLHGGIEKALSRSAHICSYDDDYLSQIVDKVWLEVYRNKDLHCGMLIIEHSAIQLRILYRFFLIQKLKIRFETLERILLHINNDTAPRKFQLSESKYIEYKFKKLIVSTYE